MGTRAIPILRLDELTPGQEADLFLLLAAREELPTRDGKKYLRVTFRDATREVSFPIWNDSPHAQACRDEWNPGAFYKVRATYRESQYGPQLEIERIREATTVDEADGFDPAMCLARSKRDGQEMFDELLGLVEAEIRDPAIRQFTIELLNTQREAILLLPADLKTHHAYAGGWLEHTLSTAKLASALADHFQSEWPALNPPLDRDLVVAGAILHDIGKAREYAPTPLGAEATAAGHLIGHLVQGRDLIREAAAGRAISSEWLLRLEHVMLAHQGSHEHGSPKLPMTAEAMLVHFADDADAKFHMLYNALRDDAGEGLVTSRKNALLRAVFRG